MTKHQFKICEAVALGLTHYYIGLKLNRNFGEFLHKIFHKNNRSTAQQGKG